MRKYILWIIPLAMIAIAAGWYLTQKPQEKTPVVDSTASQSSAPAQTSAPAAQYPLSKQQEIVTLPDLDSSDEYVKSSLEKLFGLSAITAALIPTQIIRHIVATIDNLPRDKVAIQLRPIRATPKQFVVSGPDDNWIIDEKNYARYGPVVHVIQATDINRVAQWYRQHYSLFQQAYQNLGYPQGYFNDRLVVVIDDLLATPEIKVPVQLTQPKVFYQFADPDLESRSAGQKTLLRMGPGNSEIVKSALRQLRSAITKPDM